MAELIITVDNFEEEVLKATKPVVVDFWATWCGPCRMQGPIIEKFAEEFGDKYIVGKIDVDEQEDLAAKYSIMSIPTIKIFKNGEVAATAIGVQSRESLLDLIGE